MKSELLIRQRLLVRGCGKLDTGCQMPETGYRKLDTGGLMDYLCLYYFLRSGGDVSVGRTGTEVKNVSFREGTNRGEGTPTAAEINQK